MADIASLEAMPICHLVSMAKICLNFLSML